MARVIAFAAIVGSVLALAAPAGAAAPNYFLVSGPGLKHPVLLGDWRQNLNLMLAVANSQRTSASLRDRPHLDLAEFWGWGNSPVPTSPAEATQHGTFYPAHGGRPAVVALSNDQARVAPKLLLRVFAAHHIPTRL
jgi:hypothetical protein